MHISQNFSNFFKYKINSIINNDISMLFGPATPSY